MFRRSFLMSVTTLVASGRVIAAPPPHEQSRIDLLIRFVEAQHGMKFVRNGTEYDCNDAAKFLRGKLESMGTEITTAREFIERIASKSSTSGRPYVVKFADGKTMLVAQFLGDELRRLEARPA